MNPSQVLSPIQALSILEAALNTAIGSGVYKNMQEVNAVLQSFSIVSEPIKKIHDVQTNFKKPEDDPAG